MAYPSCDVINILTSKIAITQISYRCTTAKLVRLILNSIALNKNMAVNESAEYCSEPWRTCPKPTTVVL